MSIFGENLKKWRALTETNQEEAAVKLGVSVHNLRGWEQERYAPILTDELALVYGRVLSDLAEEKKGKLKTSIEYCLRIHGPPDVSHIPFDEKDFEKARLDPFQLAADFYRCDKDMLINYVLDEGNVKCSALSPGGERCGKFVAENLSLREYLYASKNREYCTMHHVASVTQENFNEDQGKLILEQKAQNQSTGRKRLGPPLVLPQHDDIPLEADDEDNSQSFFDVLNQKKNTASESAIPAESPMIPPVESPTTPPAKIKKFTGRKLS